MTDINNKRKPTMNDVANLSGVSQPVVSYVLNNTAPVSAEVREKVLEAIKSLGYVPNALAKSLKQKKTNTIGLLIPAIDSGYYVEVIKHAEKHLRNKGYITFLFNSDYDPILEQLYIQTMVQQDVAGIIIGYGLVDSGIYDHILNYDIPLVVLDDKVEGKDENIACVEIDNITGGRLAIQHLKNIGAKRICFASEPLFNRALKMRYEGFVKGINQYEYDSEEVRVYIENTHYNTIDMGYNIGSKIILDNVDAVFCTTDNLAFGIIKRLQDYGYQIPEDIFIMGYDDVPFCKYITPTLSTISQPIAEMVKNGTEILDCLIKGEAVSKDYSLLEPSLIIRESTMRKGIVKNQDG